MKNTTFAKTALSTLVALTLGACAHNSPEHDYQATQKVIKKVDNSALKIALAEKDKAKNNLKTANNDITKLKNEIAKLKAKGQDTKVLEAQLVEANKKVQEFANQAKLAKEKADKALVAKATAEQKVKDAEAKANIAKKEKEKADKEIKNLQAKIDELKKKGGDNAKTTTSLQKELEQAKEKAKTATEEQAKAEEKIEQVKKEKKQAENEAKTAKQAKEKVEKELKPFKRKKEYKDGSVKYKAENVSSKADGGTSRDKFQMSIDKFSFKKIFDAEGSVDATDNATISVPVMDIDGHQVSINRHDLAYSSIASASAQIDTFMMPDWNDVMQQQTAASTVLAVTGQPTDTSKISFADLKAQNKGDLTYEGRAVYAYHVKEKHEAGGYPAKLKDAPYKYDIMKSENSWAKPTFKVNLETAKISGKMDFGTTDQALKLVLAETDIKETGNQLQFVGDINATQKREVTEKDYSGNDVTYSTPHVLGKDGKQEGKYDGVFMGPNAEELAGKFVIKQDYKRDDKKDSKYGDPVAGKYTQIGDINGVFNAKKVAGGADKKYEKSDLIK